MKRHGERIVTGQKYTLRPGAYAILPRDGKFLVTFQMDPHPEFQLPGGGVDPGENLIPALHREVWEETGWHIAAPRRLTSYRRFAYMPEYDRWAEKVCHIFVARPTLCLGDPPEKGHTALWLSRADLFAYLSNEGELEVLRRHLA
jgi:8-oxo-dGTP diphosphatase